jgi:S-adenosylmethionine-diacylglycerol 3-amino-3-carboxypropyl transferase
MSGEPQAAGPEQVSSKDQVALVDLLFGLSWEDPETDRQALAIQPGEKLITVTSGGCNTLTLLLEDPGRIFSLDINPSQSYLLELKRAAVRRLDYDDLHGFLGLNPSDKRLQTFERLRDDLSEGAARYWNGKPAAVRNGIIHAGNYESFISLFSRFLKIFQGTRRIEGLLGCQTLEQQRNYFDKTWNTVRWRLLFKLLANKWVLARRGLTVDYFKFDDGSTSFPESFLRRTRHAMYEIPIQSNYFLAQYLQARYRSEDAVPAYLLRENLPLVKQRLERIEIVTAPAQEWLANQPDASLDCFSLSNICELMSQEETGRLFAEVARSARCGARICFRNLIVPRGVPESLQDRVQLQEQLSRQLLAQDRSFVYSRVQAFVVTKGCS